MSDMRQVLQEAIKTLEFYADPFDRFDDDEPVRVPDFYSELGFGDRASDALARIRASLAEGDPVPEKTVTEADERDRYFRNAVADALDEYDGGDRDRFNLGTLGSGFFHSIRFRPGELKAIAALIRPAALPVPADRSGEWQSIDNPPAIVAETPGAISFSWRGLGWTDKFGEVFCQYTPSSKDEWICEGFSRAVKPTHWMEFPNPPRKTP